jgi:hypothetical protein
MATAHRPASTKELIRHSVSSWHRCAAPTRPPRTCARGRARRSPCRTSRPRLPQHASFARSRSEQPQALGSRRGGLGSLHRFVCTSCWQHRLCSTCPHTVVLVPAQHTPCVFQGRRDYNPAGWRAPSRHPLSTPSAASSRAALPQDLPLLWCPSPCILVSCTQRAVHVSRQASSSFTPAPSRRAGCSRLLWYAPHTHKQTGKQHEDTHV